MKTRIGGTLVVLSAALALTACSNSASQNPCLVWVADNGPYVTKYTAAPTAAADCVANQANIAGLPFDGNYDDIQMQQYVFADHTEAVLLPFDVSLLDTDPDTGARNPGTKLASANFDSASVDANNECTISGANKTTVAEDTGKNYSFVFHDLKFLEDPNAQGTVFTGQVDITTAGCTATYNITGLGPETGCKSDTDCLPVPNAAAGRPFSSGIASELHTYCDLSDAAKNWEGKGVCFLAEAYPSLCPAGTIEGEAGSACPIGKK